MPRIKTCSDAKKRFEISKNGRVTHGRAFKSHVLNKKSTKRKRVLHQTTVTGAINVAKIRKMLPYR